MEAAEAAVQDQVSQLCLAALVGWIHLIRMIMNPSIHALLLKQ